MGEGAVSRAHTKGPLLLTREIAETIQFVLSSVAATCLLWPAVSAFGSSRVTAAVEKETKPSSKLWFKSPTHYWPGESLGGGGGSSVWV